MSDLHALVQGDNTFTAIAWDASGRTATDTVTVNLLTNVTCAYDLNGNLCTNGTEVLVYDDENRLVTNYVAGAWKSEFGYDGQSRRRIQRDYAWSGGGWVQTNEVRLVYDGNVILQHRDFGGTPTLTLTRGLDLSDTLQGVGGIGGLLALTEGSGTHSYYHADGGGNVTMLINGSQLIVAKYAHDAFGNFLAASGPKADLNPYRFSSKPIHSPSGKYDYLYRWYSPALQRWLNKDPLEERGGINLYAYVNNNPVSLKDSFGLLPFGLGTPFPPPAGLVECSSIEGYYRHCMNSCRLNYLYGGPLGGIFGFLWTQAIALTAGGDWHNSSASSPSDRRANIDGSLIALRFGSCRAGCESNLRNRIAKYCCPFPGKGFLDKDSPLCNCDPQK